MPTNDPVAAARREAKTRARKGGTTHQQALDAIAIENGHATWSAMQASIASADRPLRGPAVFLPSELMDMQYLQAPEPAPTLKDVENRTARLMADARRRAGMRISDWIGSRMKEAATRALEGSGNRGSVTHAIRPLPFDAQMMAQAVDPEGGPWETADRLTVRCPLHDDANGSLVIGGTGHGLGMRCMAGCDDSAVQEHALSRMTEAAIAAAAFMKANDAHKVYAGAGRVPDGVGGRGGFYTLTDGSRHELGVLACRMLAEGYPDWIHGEVPEHLYAVETALRIAIAGRHRIEVAQPSDIHTGVWQAEIPTFPGYRVIVQWSKGGPIGVSTVFEHDFKGTSDEMHPTIDKAVARVLALLKSPETTDPDQLRIEEERVSRERAYMESIKGTVDGWGWWAGPNEDEFNWGGPYKTREAAIGEANGSCSEEGEVFFVIQARTEPGGPDDDGMYRFLETRGLRMCKAT